MKNLQYDRTSRIQQKSVSMKLVYNHCNLPSPAHKISDDSCRMLGNSSPIFQKNHRGQLFGLFDGMGSLNRGGDSARFMGDSLVKYFRSSEGLSGQALRNVLIQANNEISTWQPPAGSKYKRDGGCAGTIALCADSQGQIFHSGDTTALLLQADYEEEDDHLLLTACHNSSPGGLTSFWGIGDSLLIDYSKHPFVVDDILFLASDGLTDVMDNGEIARRVRQMDYFTEDECLISCRKLCTLARKRGSEDDITALLIYREE